MSETIDSIITWHKKTFPGATLEGQLKKYDEEKEEFVKSNWNDLSELADMFIVACGVARFDMCWGIHTLNNVSFWRDVSCFDTCKLCEAIEKKMQKNRKRVWNKTDNGTYHHELGVED